MHKILYTLSLLIITTASFSQTDLLLEDFQNGIPNNWTVVNNDNLTPVFSVYTNAWISIVDPENSNDTVASSTSYFSPVGSANRWLITPAITLGSFGNYVDWNAKSQDASVPDSYLVLVSKTDNQLSSFTDTVGIVQEENFEWTNRQIDLSLNGYNNETIFVAFVNNTNDGFKLYLDSIHLRKDDYLTLDKMDKLPFSIFPNPTNSIINIQSTENINSIFILNEYGQVIRESNKKLIDVSDLNSGVYFIKIESNESSSIQKFIKY